MKAVIMAGGEGKRLKAVTGPLPKPMVKLLGKPLMERCLELLRENGITEVCASLRYNPGPIMAYFGDGERFGMEITWRVETEPMGTAGGVRGCMDALGDGDFIVMSGDAACDFDLRRLMREHRRSGAAVTVALYECSEPLSYGVAVTDAAGDIRGFIEKPSWRRVCSDLVSTGIYAVSPRAMDYVPEGRSYDFARDLFPRLLERGERIHGVVMPGYWCDVGTPRSYYRCCVDALDGRLRLPDAVSGPEPAPEEAYAPLAGENLRRLRVKCRDRARLMRAMSAALMEAGADFSDGLTISSAHAAARVSPEPGASELVIEATARDAGFAEALSRELAGMAEELSNEC